MEEKEGQVINELNKKSNQETKRTKRAILLMLLGVVLIVAGLSITKKAAVNSNEVGIQYTEIKKIGEQLIEKLGVKEEIHALPELTVEERSIYEEEWYEYVVKEKKNIEDKIIFINPNLSDKQVQEYVEQVFQYMKEYVLKLFKYNQKIIQDAKDAIEAADKANAMAELAQKYTELLTQHMQTSPGQSYEANQQDLQVLQQHVMEKTYGKYTVKISNSESKYEVLKNED